MASVNIYHVWASRWLYSMKIMSRTGFCWSAKRGTKIKLFIQLEWMNNNIALCERNESHIRKLLIYPLTIDHMAACNSALIARPQGLPSTQHCSVFCTSRTICRSRRTSRHSGEGEGETPKNLSQRAHCGKTRSIETWEPANNCEKPVRKAFILILISLSYTTK